MGALGYYVKHVDSAYEYREFIDLTKVIEEWDTGFYIENNIIDSEGIYYESATWEGKLLNYNTLGQSVKRKKYEAVKKLISTCRSELEYLGQSGEKVDSPNIQGGDFFFVLTEDVEMETDYYRSASYYWIESVVNGIVTYRHHSVNTNYLCINDKIYRISIEDFVDRIDKTYWYRISGNLYLAAAKKIVYLTKRIYEMLSRTISSTGSGSDSGHGSPSF